jgi:hypothetical protein
MKEVLDRVNRSLQFGREINKLLLSHLILDFQVKTANKMFANPARFMFSNAIVWNGFVTAVDLDLRISLPLLREVVLAVNMAPMIAENPPLAKDICPSIPLNVVAFVLMTFTPDEDFPKPIDPMKFMETFEIWGLPPDMNLPEPDASEFVPLVGLKWERWRKWRLDGETLEKFPFLKNYVSK